MPLWSEQSSPENLDSIVWPRLAAAAEVFWTGETLPDGTSRLGANPLPSSRCCCCCCLLWMLALTH